MRVDESAIDLHGWLRAFYSCGSLGRSFVMDNSVQRPLPSYADFTYDRKNYGAILKEVLNPLGLKLVQGKWVDAVVAIPPRDIAGVAPASPPAPLAGALAGGGGVPASVADLVDSAEKSVDSLGAVADTLQATPPRRLVARASGLLKSSAKKLGFDYTEILASAGATGTSAPKVNQLWNISARASDSLGSFDFARVVTFSAGDTAHLVFGGETRRAESTLNYENGSALTQYSSVFDGLTVDILKDNWKFIWRGSGSVLEVPGIVGSCASGSSRLKFDSVRGVPFLGRIPVLGYLFSFKENYDDELLIAVCVEVEIVEIDGGEDAL